MGLISANLPVATVLIPSNFFEFDCHLLCIFALEWSCGLSLCCLSERRQDFGMLSPPAAFGGPTVSTIVFVPCSANDRESVTSYRGRERQ